MGKILNRIGELKISNTDSLVFVDNSITVEHVGNCGIGTGMRIPTTIDVNGSVGIMPFSYNPTEKLVVREHKHLRVGNEAPKRKLDIKGKLSLKSKLILFYKKYLK